LVDSCPSGNKTVAAGFMPDQILLLKIKILPKGKKGAFSARSY
jgi:hypothetical protein